MRLRAVGQIAFGEKVAIQVGCGLTTHTETQTVVEVLRDKRVDGANVKLTGFIARACFQIVLKECFQHKNNILKALQLLQMIEETTHASLTLGKLHLSMFGPELIATVVGARLHL